MAIHVLQGIIPILPTHKSSAKDDLNLNYLSTILKPIDHYSTGGIGDPRLSKKPHKYISLDVGWIYKKNVGTLKGNVSYSRIYPDDHIPDPDNYELKHKVEIKDYSVYLDDQLIASAPTKKTKAFKEKFCKAIVWQLMNDSTTLKDKLQEISGIVAMPEKIPGYIPYLNLTINEVCTA
jgi:hypothetical protein